MFKGCREMRKMREMLRIRGVAEKSRNGEKTTSMQRKEWRLSGVKDRKDQGMASTGWEEQGIGKKALREQGMKEKERHG